MAIRPIAGQTMGLVPILSFICWAVMTRITAGQEHILTRQYDNLKPTEIRLDSRAIRWMDFTKPERQPQQQNHQQWLQPPMPVNSPRRTVEQQWNQHAQNWPGYYDYPQQAHTEQRNTADHQYRPPKPVEIQQPRQHPQQQPAVIASAPVRSSSQQWQQHQQQQVAQPRGPTHDAASPSIYDVRSSDDEILDEEYDSSELFDEDELELELELEPLRTVDSTPVKTAVMDKVPEKEDEDETIDILSAFGLTPGLSSLPRRVEESGSDKEIEPLADVPQVSPESIQQQATWQRYPQLLAPRTPPGKRVIVTEEHPASNPKAVDNHRVSYGLTAASVYARLQPSLRPRNGTGGLRQKVVPRPYKRRPVTVTSTTNLPMANNSETPEDEEDLLDPDLITEQTEIDNDEFVEDIELEEEEEEEEEETTIAKEQVDNVVKTKENVKEVTTEKEAVKPIPEEIVKKEVEETEQFAILKNPPVDPPTVENETLKPKAPPAAAAAPNNPVDIKTLLRSAGPLSLSEILQQKGMSLAELLKGGSRVAPVIGITTIAPSTNIQADTTTTQHASSSTTIQSITTTTKATVTTNRPETLPTVKPISLRELLAAKNMSLQEIVQPSIRSNNSATEKPSGTAPTLKPGVKRPIPFTAGRGKGLVGLVAPPAPPDEPSTESSSIVASQPSSPKPLSQKPISELKPLIFGGARPIGEAETTTTTTTTRTTSRQMVIQSKRPYLAGTNVGEYGTHLGRSFEENEDEENNGTRSLSSNMIGSYGMQRPIATSRLTPPPPRKQRPVLNFNYNALSEDEEEDGATDTTTQAPILTHFNEEELNENHPYFDLPVSVRNAIIVSSTIGGFCLVVFIVILVLFRIRQKTRIRLRHPAALLGLGGVIDTTASNGSDSSGITTPVSHPASKSGYAKLPRRSSSLWGTLRRSVRQMESVHYS